MAGGCENVTARCEATCSLSWSIPTLRRTTMAARGNCGPPPHTERSPVASVRSGALICSLAFDPSWAPPHDRERTHIRQFVQSWTASLSFRRVEQIQTVQLRYTMSKYRSQKYLMQLKI